MSAMTIGGVSSASAVIVSIPASTVWSTAAVISIFAARTTVAANETFGMCGSDDECTAVVRSRYPTQSTAGVGLCECYSSSSTSPFDECEGETDGCLIARCMNGCAGLEGYCLLTADTTDGTCDLRQIILSNSTSSATNETVGTCSTDDECKAVVRSQFPAQSSAGVELCDCYAASSTSPFDECEGKETDCMTAKCMDSCAGFEGYCLLTADTTDGTCDLRQVASQSNSPAPSSSPISTSSSNETVGSCTADDECVAQVRSRSPLQSSVGVELCDCYAASSTSPFDECEGEETDCMMAKCMDSCAGFEGYCLLSPDSADGTKTCVLRQISISTPPTTSPSPTVINAGSAVETVGSCTSDNECTAIVRSRLPSESNVGVNLCDCYATSSSSPFDECEGESDETCAIAKCMNSCGEMEAYCFFSPDSANGTCVLRQATNSSVVSGPTTSPSTNITLTSANSKGVESDLVQSSSSSVYEVTNALSQSILRLSVAAICVIFAL